MNKFKYIANNQQKENTEITTIREFYERMVKCIKESEIEEHCFQAHVAISHYEDGITYSINTFIVPLKDHAGVRAKNAEQAINLFTVVLLDVKYRLRKPNEIQQEDIKIN